MRQKMVVYDANGMDSIWTWFGIYLGDLLVTINSYQLFDVYPLLLNCN